MLTTLFLSTLVVLASPLARQGRLALPPSAARDACPDTVTIRAAARVPTDWPAWPGMLQATPTPSAWHGDAPWQRWVALLAAEARAHEAGDAADPERRAALTELALLQGRHADAWNHFTLACGATRPAPGATGSGAAERTERLDRLAQALVFGLVPADEPAWPGSEEDEAGAVLRLVPALPPPLDTGDPRVEHVLRVRGLEVGASRFDLAIGLERDGVEVSFTRTDGPPFPVAVRLPEPPGVRIASLYADWIRAEDAQAPARLLVGAEEAETTAWGRFQRAPIRWPERLPDELGALRRSGLVLIGTSPLLPPCARALAALLELEVRVAASEPPPAPGLAPLRVRLADPPGRELAAMLSLVEALLLGTPRNYGDAP